MDIIKYSQKIGRDVIHNIEKSCFNPPDIKMVDYILDDLENNIIYLAKIDERYVGSLMIYDWGEIKDYIKITNLGILEEFRGREIALILIKTMIEEMKEKGKKIFKAETRVTNYPMRKVFNKLGFIKDGIKKDYYDEPLEDAYNYVLHVE